MLGKHHQTSLVNVNTCQAGRLCPIFTCVSVFCYLSQFSITCCLSYLFSFLCVCSSKSTESGGHGLTTNASRSSFWNTRRARAPRASQRWTIWPRPPVGPFSGPERGGLSPQTHASRERIRPKIYQGADVTFAFLL